MANIITSIRILCSIALFFVSPLSKKFYILYLAAGLSDMIDGPVARKTETASDFGSGCLHCSHNCRNPGSSFYSNEKSESIV